MPARFRMRLPISSARIPRGREDKDCMLAVMHLSNPLDSLIRPPSQVACRCSFCILMSGETPSNDTPVIQDSSEGVIAPDSGGQDPAQDPPPSYHQHIHDHPARLDGEDPRVRSRLERAIEQAQRNIADVRVISGVLDAMTEINREVRVGVQHTF